jgi:hypothetical protein
VANGETHHARRSETKFDLRYIFYGGDYDGNMSADDKSIAEKLIAANALNLGPEKYRIRFYPSAGAIELEL